MLNRHLTGSTLPQVLIVIGPILSSINSNTIGPSTRDDYSNVVVLERAPRWRRWREEDRRIERDLHVWLEDAKRYMKCQAHRAPPVAVDLAASEREPGFPVSLEGRRPLLRHRVAGQRARVPIRSRPGFRAAA